MLCGILHARPTLLAIGPLALAFIKDIKILSVPLFKLCQFRLVVGPEAHELLLAVVLQLRPVSLSHEQPLSCHIFRIVFDVAHGGRVIVLHSLFGTIIALIEV